LVACDSGGTTLVPESPPTGPSVAVVGTADRAGVVGFALADSLRVRVLLSTGLPAANVAVSYSAVGGVVSPETSVTDADGVAAAQLIPSQSQTSVTASVAGAKSVKFSAISSAKSDCVLGPGAGAYNEAPTDYATFLRPEGELKAIMLLADFPDLPAAESASEAAAAFLPEASDYFAEASYGRMRLNVTVLPRWLRMPKSVGSYAYNPRVGGDPYALVRDMIAAADSVVDFTPYSLVYFVPTLGTEIYTVSLSPLNANVISADGKRLRYLTLLGRDFRFAGSLPATARYGLAHETSHQFGLPDLYANAPTSSVFEYAGYWDVMSYHTAGTHFTAWQKQKLGWLQSDEILCFDHAGVEATLQPLEILGGLKAIAVRVSATKAIVAEVRRRTGRDSDLGDEGLLVYTVDASVASGNGPIRVLSSATAANPSLTARFGPLYNATFGTASGKSKHYEDLASGVTIDVVSDAPPAMRVRISRR